MGFFSRFFEKRSHDDNTQWPSLSAIMRDTTAGIKVDEFKALQLSAAYACIRLISTSIAMLPLTLHQKTGRNSRMAEEHPLNRVLYRLANKDTTAYLFKQTMQSHVLMYGNAYAEKIVNNMGQVMALNILAPWDMTIDYDKSGNKIYIYKPPQKEKKEYRPEQIFHLPGLSFDGTRGYSPIQVMKNELGLGFALQDFGSNYFKNGTNMGGIISHPEILGENGRKHLQKTIEENFMGSEKAMKLMVLEEGMKYEKIGIPAEDAQFLQSKKFTLEEICRFYGVQLHMIQNLDKSSFNNIEQQSIEFKTYCLGPWAVIWEQEIYKSLLNEQEQNENYYSKFNFNALMRGDYKTRMEGYRTGVQMGLHSLNEVREMEDENPILENGGDTHWVNSAMIPIENQLSGGAGGDTNGQGNTQE